MIDRRDPEKLGSLLLEQAVSVRKSYGQGIPLSEVWDRHVSKFVIPDYQTDLTTIEKYGRPRDIEPHYAWIRVR